MEKKEQQGVQTMRKPVKYIGAFTQGEKTYHRYFDENTGITYDMLVYVLPEESSKLTFKFESPAFEQAKEKTRKEYNRITIKSTGEVYAYRDPVSGDIIIKKVTKMEEYPEFMYLETNGEKIPNIVSVDGKKYLLTVYLGNSRYYYRNLEEDMDSLEIDFSKFKVK